MNRVLFTIAVLSIALTTGVAGGTDKRSPASTDGEWRPVQSELAGQPIPDETLKTLKLIIKGDSYIVHVGALRDEGKLKFDSSKKPHTVDITGSENGPNKGKTFLAIYELNGDKLRICYDLAGKERPKEFKTTKGTQQFYVTYERVKP
jgi:uncharacterized protein (TIGR03067 family)